MSISSVGGPDTGVHATRLAADKSPWRRAWPRVCRPV